MASKVRIIDGWNLRTSLEKNWDLAKRATTLNKDLDKVISDIDKLFPEKKLEKNPKLANIIDQYKISLENAKTQNATMPNWQNNNNMTTYQNATMPNAKCQNAKIAMPQCQNATLPK